jgi:hypothetical protein
MANGEKDRYNDLLDKLENTCEANHLVARIKNSAYPFTLTIVPDTSLDGQMSMIEEDQHFNGKDSRLVFCFEDGALTYRIKGFTLPEATLNKLKNLAKKLHHAWLEVYFRTNMEPTHVVEDDEDAPKTVPEDELWETESGDPDDE